MCQFLERGRPVKYTGERVITRCAVRKSVRMIARAARKTLRVPHKTRPGHGPKRARL